MVVLWIFVPPIRVQIIAKLFLELRPVVSIMFPLHPSGVLWDSFIGHFSFVP